MPGRLANSTPPPSLITAAAHAKINLALAVGPPEPPRGYHPIASWFVCVGLHDDVIVERLADGSTGDYRIEWAADAPLPSPIDWPLDKDLGVRAHRALEVRAGRSLPIRLTLRKRIPVGGGLGGGSSDAAAVLRAVNRAFELGLAVAELREIGAALGSDVAFFLDDEPGPEGAARPALVEGFGERLSRTGRVGGVVTLLFPPFGCPTGEVYKAFDADARPLRADRVHALIGRFASEGMLRAGDLFNDLAAPAECVAPRLAEYRARLASLLHQPVHVTGSGSTMFVLAEGGKHARALARDATAPGAALTGLAAAAAPLI